MIVISVICVVNNKEWTIKGRKNLKSTMNCILLIDKGFIVTMPEPIKRNYNNLFEITTILEEGERVIDRLFLNVDAGFDLKGLINKCETISVTVDFAIDKHNRGNDQDYYFDKDLYKERYSIKRINAWMGLLYKLTQPI